MAAFKVVPTGQPASNQYSDISMTALFSSHVAMLNSERQAIWQRYSAMLVANSFFLAFLDRQQPRFGALIGLLLCAAWAITTCSGYRLFFRQITGMEAFGWLGDPPPVNPIDVSADYVSKGDWIYRMAIFVIALFAVAYVKFLVWG
jgi:hypothetical protein